VATKVKETYGMNNHAHFPNENLPAGRPVEPVPNAGIYELLRDQGCQFGFHNGWESANYFDPGATGQHGNAMGSFQRPVYKDKVEAECRGMADFGGICYWPFAKFSVTGPGAAAFLDGLVPNRLPKVGRCALSYFLTPASKVGSEVMIVRRGEDDFYVVSYPEQELFDWRWLNMKKPLEGVDIRNITADFGTLMVSGPQSRRVLGQLAGDEAAWSKDSFKFYQHRDVVLAGIPCRALRVSFTGELGWELHPATEDVAPLYKALKAAEPRLNDWGGFAMGSFRLEKGFKAFGSDMTRDHTALEAGIEGKFLRVDEKDFVGRDAIVAEGTAERRLVHLGVGTPDGQDCAGNEPIFDSSTGKVVGFTTSGGYGYLAQQSIAFGYVASASLESALEVEVLGVRYPVFIQKGAFKPKPLEAPVDAPGLHVPIVDAPRAAARL
jgi:dimethylglycine dehydrogenase